MNHLDEGIIHAWLDGALDANRSREVQQHVDACPACASAVAEARGLIAGASRILTALDDAPSGVIPRRAPAAPAAPRGARRMWRAAPWVTGIAAVLLAAVVLRTSNESQRSVVQQTQAVTADSSRQVEWAPVTVQREPSSASVGQTAVTPATGAERLAGKAVATPDLARPTARRSAVSISDRPLAIAADQRVPEAAPASASGAGIVGAAGRAASAPRPLAKSSAANDAGAAVAAAPPPSMDSLLSTRRAARAQMAREMSAPPAPVPAGSLAGCYNATVPEEPSPSTAPTAQSVVQRARIASGERAAAQPAAPRAALRAEPPVLLIDLAATRVDGSLVARDARADSVIGTWSVIGADTAEVALKTGARLRVARDTRVDCPR